MAHGKRDGGLIPIDAAWACAVRGGTIVCGRFIRRAVLTSCGVVMFLLNRRCRESIYFEVEVHWWSYLIAAVITLVFALLVQLITNPVLDRIDPVSSLKSVE